MVALLKDPATAGFTTANSIPDLLIKFIGTPLSKAIDTTTINAALDLLVNANVTSTSAIYVSAINSLLSKASSTYVDYATGLYKALAYLNNITVY